MDKSKMIIEMIEHYTNGNKAQFSKLLGVSAQNISAWITRGTFDSELIYTKCRGISPAWLLTGEGPMLQNSASDAASVSSVSSDKESLTLSDNTGPVLMQNGPGSHNNHQKVIGADGTCSGREMAMQATIELQKKMIEDRDNEIAFLRDMLRKGK